MNDTILKEIILSSFPLKRFLYNKEGNLFCSLHALPKLMFFLRDDKRTKLSLIDIFANVLEKNIDVCYLLKSYENNTSVIIRIETNNKAPSISMVFKNASAIESEIYDMNGIIFDGNENLRRTTCDSQSISMHPLSKDFPFYGIASPVYNDKTNEIDIEEIIHDN